MTGRLNGQPTGRLIGRRRISIVVRVASLVWAAVAGVLVLAGGLGCDGPYQQFLDAIPTATIASDEPAQVFLGIDGLSASTFARARERGAFAGYNTSELVTPFPGTSDYVWTRILRAGSLGGYEVEYFDSERNVIESGGVEGLAEHPLREGIAGVYPCYQRFDFLGDGETWQLDSYLNPTAAIRATLDALFDTLAARGRTQSRMLAYLLNVDVVGHQGGPDQVVAMLVEIDRRIREFKADHQRPFKFTIFADHGNAHLKSTLVDPRQILRDVGVTPVEALTADAAVPPGTADPSVIAADPSGTATGSATASATASSPDVVAGGASSPDVAAGGTSPSLEAVPIVHTRVNYVALHATQTNAPEIAARSSRHAHVDLAVARLPAAADGQGGPRYGVWRKGELFAFRRDASGTITVENPDTWSWLGVDFRAWRSHGGATAKLEDRDAFDATLGGPYPDIFYRVATGFTHPASRFPADVLLSMPDDIASFGFEVPGGADVRAVDGFHGSLSRASTMSVLASEGYVLPRAVRGDDLADMFPILAGVR